MALTVAAGQIILADHHNSIVPVTALKTADEPAIISSTTLQDDDHLFVPVEANATYEFELTLLYNTPTAADLKIGWTFPTGLTMAWGGVGYNTAEVLVTFGGLIQTSAPAFGGGAADLLAQLTGTISVGANAGTLKLQSAQNTSNAGSTITRKGSKLVLHKT